MFYLVNLKTHVSSTVKVGSNTHNLLVESGSDTIKIGHDTYRVFTTIPDAKAFLGILLLTGGGE